MWGNFKFNNVTLKKHEQDNWLVIQGEVVNNCGRNYSAVVFRAVVFIRSIPIGNTTFTLNGFYNGQTRAFEQRIGDLEYQKVIRDITRYEIYPESGY